MSDTWRIFCTIKKSSLLAQLDHRHLSSQHGTATLFVGVLDLGENLSMELSTPELQALVIATRGHIHHLIRELQLMYLNSLLDLLDGHLDVQHVTFVKLVTFSVVLFLKTSIAFCNVLMTSSLSGDFLVSSLISETFCVTESFFQPAVTVSQRELICHHFMLQSRLLQHHLGARLCLLYFCKLGSDSEFFEETKIHQ